MTDDFQLLRRYVENGSEEAFAQLVQRYLDLVYSAELRQVGGDAQLAQDVVQTVFAALSLKARGFANHTVLGGWLYRHTSFVARQTLRTERRRRVREQQAVQMNVANADTEPAWEHLAPFLDEAMGQLGGRDRDAIVLRYFERLDMRGVGSVLGTSEEAAKKRVLRAVEKLRSLFKRRGLTLTGASLASLLAAHAVTAAPVGLAAIVTGAALSGVATTGAGNTYLLLKLMTSTKLKAGIIGVLVAASVATPLVIQHQVQSVLRDENRSLRQQVEQLTRLKTENERLSN